MAVRRAARLYDAALRPAGELRTAEIAELKLRMIPLSTAVLRVPTDAAVGFRTFVELYDAGGRRIDLFRVSEIPERAHGGEGMARLSCDHALCTLKDDILPGYVQLGGATQDLRGAVEAVLAHQTGPVRWELDRCDFETRYEYGMSCENLLAALLKLLEPLEDWMIVTDTGGGRLRLSIVRLTDEDAGELRYHRNMAGIVETVREEGFATRLYPLGYGEGVNQLDIRSVNGGCPYIDAPTAAAWGVVARPYVDTTITDAQTLLAAARAALAVSQNPQVTYSVTAADLSLITGEAADAFIPGRMMRVIDRERGLSLRVRITEVTYPRPMQEPGNARLTLATQMRDVATVIAELTRRSYESRLYGQGSTFIFADSIEQNADSDTPAEGDIYIPENMIHVNAVKLKVKLTAYRADSKGAADGGGTTRTTTAGGQSTRTSSAGGGTTLTVEARTASQAITSGSPMADGASNVNTGYAKASDGGNMSSTGGASGTTGSSGEQATGVSRNANGPMRITGSAGAGNTGSSSGTTGSGGGGNTGAPQSEGGAKLTTDSGGDGDTGSSSGTTGSGGGGNTGAPQGEGGAKLRTDSGGDDVETGTAEPDTGEAKNGYGIIRLVDASGGGTTGSNGEQTTGAPKNANGAISSTDAASGTTGSNGEQSTGAARDANGSMSSTGSAGSHSHSASTTHRHTVNDTYTSYNSPGATASAGSHSHNMGHWHTLDGHSHSIGSHTHGMGHWHTLDGHSHSVSDHTHGMLHWHAVNAHSHTQTAHSHGMSHWHKTDAHTHSIGAHTHELEAHSHGMDHWHLLDGHTHDIGSHTHDMTHRHEHDHYHLVNVAVTIPGQTLSVPSHTHSVDIPDHSHSVTLGDHTHGIDYGIYKGPRASEFVVEIDGAAIPAEAFDERGEGDSAPYHAKDEDGRIKRGHFHTLAVRPVATEGNPKGLCRVRASWNAQVFISSLVGVQY